MSAVIFITIISWYNVLSHFYEDIFNSTNTQGNRYKTTFYVLGFAILVTVVSFFIFLIVYNYFYDKS